MLTNSNISYTGLVEKYIGSAYDKMALLSDNLDALIALAESVDSGELGQVAEIADLIPIVIEDIAEFQELYYGALSEDPTESPTGAAILIGAMYFNDQINRLRIYTEGGWINLGEGTITRATVTVTADMTSDAGASYVIPIEPAYTLGGDNLTVFAERTGYDGPILQVAKSVDPVNGTYTETTADSITFLGSDIAIDNVITYSIVTGNTGVLHTVDIDQEIMEITSPSITVITIPAGKTYTVGAGNLEVYKDRVLQIRGAGYDYVESSNTTITFNTPLDGSGTPIELVFNIGNVVSNAPSITTLMQGTPPDVNAYAAGTEWFNTTKGRYSILYVDANTRQWVSTSAEHGYLVDDGIPVPPTGAPQTIFSEITPDPNLYAQGSRWFNIATGVEHILYIDTDTAQWVRVSGDINGITQGLIIDE